MGTPIFIEVLTKPLTAATCVLLVAIWAWLSHCRLGYVDCGFNYDQVVGHHQYWRLLTSVVSHIDIIHLLFNTATVWSLGYAETLLGSLQWATTTLLLVITTNMVRRQVQLTCSNTRFHYRCPWPCTTLVSSCSSESSLHAFTVSDFQACCLAGWLCCLYATLVCLLCEHMLM